MEPPIPEATVATTRKPMRVLLVDDERADRDNVRRALRSGGLDVEVEEAHDWTEAKARFATRHYDCIFLKDMLPDGHALAAIHAARLAGIQTPFIVLSAQADERAAVEIMKAGAADHIPRELASPERLSHCLRNAIRIFEAERLAELADKERARALVLERHARDEAEAAQRRLVFLAEASSMATASLDYETTLENVAKLAVPSLADWCFVDLLKPDGSFDRMAVSCAEPGREELARRLRRNYDGMPDAPHGVSRVIAKSRSEVLVATPDWVLVSLARDREHLALLRELAPGSMMTVPLVARGRTLGAITFIAREAGRYTQGDLEFAEELARRAALAVDNARLFLDAKLAEERLRHQLDFTTTITGSLAEGVLALDRSGRVTFANPAAGGILHAEHTELVGRSLEDVVHQHADDEVCPLVNAVTSGGVLRVDDDRFERRDGTSVPVSYVVSPIVSDGEITGSVLAFHDASERRRAAAELDASRRQLAQNEKLSALGTLVSGVAHELRTPLTYLSNNLFLLQAKLDAAARTDPKLAPLVAESHRFSQAALDGVDWINALVRDLRPFANTEGGRRAIAGLHDVVGAAVDLFRATQRGRVEVEASLGPTPPLLLERGEIQRVVINLLMNAAEAMPSGGRIRVVTRVWNGAAQLDVTDEGSGIPPEVEARIFDPFYTTKADGTGLGLAITRRIIESHGGTIDYKTALGQGTTFSITLPLTETPLASAVPSAAAPTTP